MPTIIPISSKSGVVVLDSNAHVFGEQWSANLTIENDEYKHFEMDADTNGLIWALVLTGFSKGEGTVRAQFDSTVGSILPTDKLAWLDQSGTGYLGYTSVIGFIISYTIVNVRPATDTNNPKSSMFDFDVKITACTFTSTGP